MLSSMYLIVFLSFIALVSCRSKEPVCVQPFDAVGAYPCESRPSKEPLSLQYSKAQSKFKDLHIQILSNHFCS